MMKKILIIILCSISAMQLAAQDAESTGGFKKQNLFTGGNVALGFGSGTTSIGIGPYFGYSLNKYVDAAIGVNYNYVSQRDYYTPTKFRQSIVGPTAFVRLFPVNFLFAQAQFEHNFIQQKIIYQGYPDEKATANASSFLIGPGYAGGRGEGASYYYISVLFDVAKNRYSPYLDNFGRVTPIIRAGFNIALFQGNENRGRSSRYSRRTD